MNLTGTERRTILVVDCNDTFFRHTEQALRRAAPRLSAIQRSDGREGLGFLARCRPGGYPVPAAIIVDGRLPGELDGYAVVRALRGLEPLAEVPVFLCCETDEPDHVHQAMAARATSCLKRPVLTDEFPGFAQQILGRLAGCWRGYDGDTTGQDFPVSAAMVRSAPVPMVAATSAHVVPAAPPDTAWLVFLQDLFRRSVDPIDAAINESCRRHHIPPSHARGKAKDQYTVANRHAVLFDLFDLGMGDKVILENFCLEKRQFERLRAEWRAKGGGLLTDRSL